jgi:hypothetical protein
MKEENVMFRYENILYLATFTPESPRWKGIIESGGMPFEVDYNEEDNEIRIYPLYETVGGWYESNGQSILIKTIK